MLEIPYTPATAADATPSAPAPVAGSSKPPKGG
jgi:hypothetical protein